MFDVQDRVFVFRFSQAFECELHGAVRVGTEWAVVQAQLGEGELPVVIPRADVDGLEMVLEQGDGRQDAFAVQAVRIQRGGFEVGRDHQAHAVFEQGLEQAVQDQRVRDIGNVELVEANQAVSAGDAAAEFPQRIGCSLQVGEFAMHLAHELVKMQARLAQQRDAEVEAVHDETFAAAHPTVQVHATRERRARHQLRQDIAAARLVLHPFVFAALQRLERAQLPGVGTEAALAPSLLVKILERHVGPRLDQKFKLRLSTASAASLVDSLSEGWAWQMRAMSSALALNAIATTASAINSEAKGPTICTPRISSVRASASIFTNPPVSPSARARPLATNGKLPPL